MAGSAAADMTSSLLPRLSPPPFCEMASALTKLVPKLVTKSVTVSTLLYRKLPVNPAPNTLPGPAPGFPQMETCAHAADARVAKPRERVRAWTGPGAAPGVHLRCKSVPLDTSQAPKNSENLVESVRGQQQPRLWKAFLAFLGEKLRTRSDGAEDAVRHADTSVRACARTDERVDRHSPRNAAARRRRLWRDSISKYM